MARFKKGEPPPKNAGRKPGSKGRVTENLRKHIDNLLNELYPQVKEDILSLKPRERVQAFIKLLEYSVPKKREQKIDLSSLSDEEVNELLKRAVDMAE